MNDDSKLIIEDGSTRSHKRRLNSLLETSDGPVRVASAYVTDTEFFLACKDRDRRLLTSLNSMDLASGATSSEALQVLLESGVEIRIVNNSPRFHAKVYVIGSKSAVVTSANLTHNAFRSNIEVGVEVSSDKAGELIHWYDELWKSATKLDIDKLKILQELVKSIRDEYVQLNKKARESISVNLAANNQSKTISTLLKNAKRFFLVNTNRRYDTRAAPGEYELEAKMHRRGLATAWTDFNHEKHMEEVQAGDIILAYAKGVGVIGLGVAESECEVLGTDHSDRIRSSDEYNGDEWRVPTQWIVWNKDDKALKLKVAPNATFVNVTSGSWGDIPEQVRQHSWD